MATNFPTALDSYSSKTDNVTNVMAADPNNLQDAVLALEAKVGKTNSAVTTSIDYILKNNIWPIGAIFHSSVSTNPGTLIGFGTWTQIAQGKVLIGQNASDSDFDTAAKTGGSKTSNALIAHTHTGSGTSSGISVNHTHGFSGTSSGQSQTHTHNVENLPSAVNGTTDGENGGSQAQTRTSTGASNDHTHTYSGNTGTVSSGHTHTYSFTSSSTGSGSSFSIMNPYYVVYIFERTA